MGFITVVTLSFLLIFVIGNLIKRSRLLFFIVLFFCLALIRTFIVQPFKIPSGSMIPTILVGDHILTNKYIYSFTEPAHGDLIIFPFPKSPKIDYIKRVVAIGGDTIEVRNKNVFLNGKQITEPYAVHLDSKSYPPSNTPRDTLAPIKIPYDSLFVMGDNRDNSNDSRFWGLVKKNTVKARVELIYWSWDADNNAVRWSRMGKFLQ